MKLTKKQLRKLITESLLKEFFEEDKFGSDGGIIPPYIDPGDGGGGRFTPCENFDSKKHQKSLKIVQSLFQQAYEIRGESYTFLKQSGFSEDQIFSIDRKAEVYLESDLATELCKAGNTLEKRMEILISLTDPKNLFNMLNDY